mgnify:CR=1 FL=1
MEKKRRNLITVLFLSYLLLLSGCSKSSEGSSEEVSESTAEESSKTSQTASSLTSVLDSSAMFTERDLLQAADLSEATYITVSDAADITICSEGVYVLSGSAEDVTVIVDAADAKVQIVLDGVSITNEGEAVIYVKDADKVFVTTSDTQNTFVVTGTFASDGDTNIDAAIFSLSDLTLNGIGTLNITSSANGVTSKDDLKVTGGTYNITAANHGLEGKDSVRIAGGEIVINAKKDGIHSGNTEDSAKGYVYISGGNISINAKSDGVQSVTVLQIDGGSLDISASEGLESTYVIINDGNITICASDDGINASSKSKAYSPKIEINGGTLNIDMGQGDTDALDANGDLVITGGYITITAQFAFDFDGSVTFSGGTVIVNGEEVTTITNSMQMGGGFGGHGH